MDYVHREILLRAPIDRVWAAITESAQFGSWFGMKLEGPFRAGHTIRGTMTQTSVDEVIAAMQQPHEGKPVQLQIERIEPKTYFSFKWHPYAPESGSDVTKAVMTTVTFHLNERDGGTFLTITEKGFDKIPPGRRAKAIRDNDGGWAAQAQLVSKYLAIHGR